ncbi:MAG: trypsin-like serine protease [Gemmataceae bacterium]|nr:trypsin-like serine protease [Gemmataceae bacterium]
MTRRTRLSVARLEDRTTPVLGGFDVPFAADTDAPLGATNLTGVVDYQSIDPATGQAVAFCSGALVDVGGSVAGGSRFVLTAAHCDPKVGDRVVFNTRLADGSLQRIEIPVVDVYVHPDWTGNTGDLTGDIALVALAAAAPVGTAAYPLYTAADAGARPEVGQTFFIGGYGLSGTGTSGQATNFELQRLTVNATGGSFRIVLPANDLGFTPGQSVALPYNATPEQVRDALLGLGIGTAAAPPGVLRPVAGPFAENSYEVEFPYLANFPRLGAVSDPGNPLVNGGNLGSAGFTTLINGAIDPEFQRLRVTATGGTFRLGALGGQTNPLPFNATAADIQTALETIPGVGEVTVRFVDAGPAAGSFEVSFDSFGTDIDLMTVDTSGLTGGTAVASTIIDGGNRVLRAGRNTYDRVDLNTLVSDFDRNGTDSFEGQGDSGGAGLVDTGGGRLAIASVVSQGGFVYGDPEYNTRVSRYATDVLAFANRPGYALTVDTNYQVAGNDTRPDRFRVTQAGDQVQVYVTDGLTGAERLYFADKASQLASVVLRGSADPDTFTIEPGVTVVVRVEGGGRDDTLVAPDRAATYTVTGADTGTAETAAADFTFAGVASIVAGNQADTFRFLPGASFSGSVDARGGADTLDLSQYTAGAAVQVIGPGSVDGFDLSSATGGAVLATGLRNFNAVAGGKFVGGDALTGPASGGTYTIDGATGTFTDAGTGRTLALSFFEGLTGGAGADTFNIRSTTGAFTVDGGAGDDVIDVGGAQTADGAIGGDLTFFGGLGSDSVRVAGLAGADNVTARLTGPGTGDFAGLPFGVSFDGVELATFDGAGGSNAVNVADATGIAWGTPADPAGGVVYSPTGATAGIVRIGTAGRIGVAGVTAGLTVTGDPDADGAKDVLAVTGTSGAGLRTAFGEHELADGRDRVTAGGTGVQVESLSAGPLLGVTYGLGADGTPAFDTVYVATGSERTADGDVVVVSPTTAVNLVVDGQGPTAGSRPGDRVSIAGGAGGTAELVSDPGFGPPQVRFTQSGTAASVGLLGFESGQPAVAGLGMLAVGSDAGPESVVRVYDRVSGTLRYQITPFPGFNGGVSVASGDVTGDGIADLVVGAGPSGGPRVAVFNGLDGSPIYDFFGYEASFRGGVNVSAADFNADGVADLVLGTGVGGGPRVRILSGRDLSPIRNVFVFNRDFRGGVNVAAGDVTGDGTPDLVNSTGAGGGPRAVVLDGRNLNSVASFFVFDPTSRAGFTAAAGDVNGDGFADIIAGSGAGEPARVRVFSGLNRSVLADFFLNDPFTPGEVGNASTAGVRVATADANGDGITDVITSQGPGSAPVVRTFQLAGVNPDTSALFRTLEEIRRQTVFEDGFNSGVFVGASN